jgi:predicted nucleic acid-binding protein
MKIAFDAGVLGLVLFPKGGIPNDFRTGKPIDRATDRVQALIDESENEKDEIVIPTPSLAEALVPVATASTIDAIVATIERQSCFKVVAFDKKAAIELALRTKNAVDAGDKKEGIGSNWQKVKYDRQIVAIAKAEGATLYSMDKHVHDHAKLWGVPVRHVADIPIPAGVQVELFEEVKEGSNAEATTEHQAAVAPSTEIRGGSDGHPQDQAGAEVAEKAKAEGADGS